MKHQIVRVLIHVFAVILFVMAGVSVFAQASVNTDQSDYPPGSTVIISGSGFQPGETVQLQVIDVSNPSDDGEEHEPWATNADENGNFTTTWYVTQDEAGMTLQLTATGQASGFVAQETFTDSGIAQRGSATTGTATSTSLTINKPTGVVQGDVMFVNIAEEGNSTTDPSLSGWTLIDGASLAGTTLRYGAVLYKVAGASEGTSYTFTLGSGTTHAAGAIVAFSGVNTNGTPFDVTPGTISVQGSQTAVAATSITTASANAAVIMFGMAAGSAPTWSGWTTTSPGALTELFDVQQGNSTDGASVGAAWATKATAGATGAGAATLSAAERNGGILVALKPLVVASKLAFTTQPANTTAGATMANVVVQLQDAGGNNVASNNVPITLTLSSGSFASGNVTTNTGVGGSVTFNNLVITNAGSFTITASASGIGTGLASANSSSFTINPGAANQLTISQQPSSTATAGTAFTTQPHVTAIDQFGNSVANGTIVTAKETSGGNLNGTATAQTATTTGGVATFSGLFVTNVAAAVTLTFSNNTHTVTSSSINVSPGAIASYAVSATTATRGTAFNVTVTAKDASGNTVTTDSSTTLTMTSSSASVLFDGNGDDSFNDSTIILTNGVSTISVKDNYFEAVTITATDGNSKTGNASVTVNPLNKDFISRATGTWSVSTTWSNWNGSAWVNAASAPTSSTSATNVIEVQSPHTVTVGTSVTASNFLLNVGGTLSISNGIIFTVGNGVANGVISDGTSNNGILVESGVGNVFTLTGNNSYGGGTVISGGTLSVTNVTTTGVQQLGSGGITFANGGTLLNTGPGAQTFAGSVTLNTGGGVITMSGVSIYLTGVISGGGGFTTGGSDLVLDRTSGFNAIGPITVNSGRLFAFNTNSLGGASITVQSGATLDFSTSGNTTPTNIITFADGSCLANRVGTLTVNTAKVTFPTSGTMIFNSDDQNTTPITISGTYPALTGDLTIQVGPTGSTTVGNVTNNAAISGSGGIIKTSTGTLVLNSANTYTGGTTVSGGFLTANVTGSLGSGALSIASGATNTLTSSTSETVAALYLNAVRQVAGTWGSAASAASHKTNYFGSIATGVLTAGAITVTAQADTKIYDGTTNAAAVPTITAGVLATGDTATLTETYNNKNQGTGKTLTPTAVITDSSSNNVTSFYNITYVNNATGVINKTNLTMTAVTSTKAYDGTTSGAATPTIMAGSIQTGDSAPTWTETYDTKNQGSSKVLTPAGVVTDGNSGLNYNYTYATVATGVINKTNLTVTAVTNTKAYDGTTNAVATPTITAGSIQPGDSAPTWTETYNNKNVGTGKTLTPSGIVNDGNSGLNYNYTYTTVATGVINKTNLTVTAATNTKTYNGTTSAAATPTITAGSIQTGDNAPTWTETYDTKNQGSGKVLTPAGVVTDGNSGLNYNYTYATVATGVINKTNLTVTAVTNTKAYDGTTNAVATPTVTAGSIQSGDTANFIEAYSSSSVGAGNKALIPSGTVTDGNSGLNYNYTFVNFTAGTITAVTLTPTVTLNNKVYDGTTNATTIASRSLSGILGSDDVNLGSSGTVAAFSSKNVGSYTPGVTGLSLSGTTAGNYTLSTTSLNPGASITARTLTVSATGVNKTYDGTTNATVTLSDNKISGDTVTDNYTAASFANKNVGTNKTVSVSGISISGADAGNYSLAATIASTTANISSRSLTISATGVNKTYDGTTNATVNLSDNKISGDTVTDNYTSASFADKNIGTNKTVSVSGISISGADAGNYSLAATIASTTANISSRSLTVSATGVNKTYDGATNATVTLSDNKISGDVVTDNYTSASFTDKNIGTGKTVNVSGISISGADAGNYNANTTTSTTANITARPITIKAVTTSKIYSGDTSALGTPLLIVGTLAGGESATYSQTFDTKDVGAGKTLTPAALIKDSGNVDVTANYSVTATTTNSGIIAAKLLSVIGLTVNSKIYDGTATATFSGTASLKAVEAIGGGGASDGKPYTGDDVSLTGTPIGTFADTNAGSGITVTITGLSLAGAQQSEYTLTNAITQLSDQDADINKASTTNVISVSANPSPTGSNVTLTATLSVIAPGAGTPTGTMQFLADGSPIGSPATLSGGIATLDTASLAHGNHTISAQYTGGENFFGSTNSLGSNLLINKSPTAGTFTLTTTENISANFAAAKLTGAAKDADHDALSLASVDSTSAQGGIISNVGGTITYLPPPNYAGPDSFHYTIADIFGGTTNGIVSVTVNATTSGQTLNITSFNMQLDGSARLQFAGIPNRNYLIQATTNIASPVWTTIATNAAGSNGLFIFVDTNAPNYPARYYRTAAP